MDFEAEELIAEPKDAKNMLRTWNAYSAMQGKGGFWLNGVIPHEKRKGLRVLLQRVVSADQVLHLRCTLHPCVEALGCLQTKLSADDLPLEELCSMLVERVPLTVALPSAPPRSPPAAPVSWPSPCRRPPASRCGRAPAGRRRRRRPARHVCRPQRRRGRHLHPRPSLHILPAGPSRRIPRVRGTQPSPGFSSCSRLMACSSAHIAPVSCCALAGFMALEPPLPQAPSPPPAMACNRTASAVHSVLGRGSCRDLLLLFQGTSSLYL